MKKKILITSILAGTAMLVSCGGSTEKEPTVSLSNECVGNTCQITANVGDDVFNKSVAGTKHKIKHDKLGVDQIEAVEWTIPTDATTNANPAALGFACNDMEGAPVACSTGDATNSGTNPIVVDFANTGTQTIVAKAKINGFKTEAQAEETITPADFSPSAIDASASCQTPSGQICSLSATLVQPEDESDNLKSVDAQYTWKILDGNNDVTTTVGSFTGGTTANDKDSEYTFNATAPMSNYTAEVTLTGATENPLTDTAEVNYVPAAGFSITQNTNPCEVGKACSFTINNPTSENGATYKWNEVAGATIADDTAQTTDITFSTTGTKTLSATITANGQTKNVPNTQVSVEDVSASVAIADLTVTGYNVSTTATLTDATATGTEPYTWTVSGGAFAIPQTYTTTTKDFSEDLPPSSADYTIQVSVATDAGDLVSPSKSNSVSLAQVAIASGTCSGAVCTASTTEIPALESFGYIYTWTATGGTEQPDPVEEIMPMPVGKSISSVQFTYTETQTGAGYKVVLGTDSTTAAPATTEASGTWSTQPVVYPTSVTYTAPPASSTSEEMAASFDATQQPTAHVASVTGNNLANTLTFNCEDGYYILPSAENLSSGSSETASGEKEGLNFNNVNAIGFYGFGNYWYARSGGNYINNKNNETSVSCAPIA